MAALEIQIPMSAPTALLDATITSLLGQTAREFSVTLASRSGSPGKGTAATLPRLQAAGLSAREAAVPPGLNEVESLNWLHALAEAPWLLLLGAGETLAPEAVARVLALLTPHPEAGLLHLSAAISAGWQPPSAAQEEMAVAPRRFGPRSACVLNREAFLALGGCRPALGEAAFELYARTAAARFGVLNSPEPLVRFRSAPPPLPLAHRWTMSGLLLYHAWTEGRALSWSRAARLLARETLAALHGR